MTAGTATLPLTEYNVINATTSCMWSEEQIAEVGGKQMAKSASTVVAMPDNGKLPGTTWYFRTANLEAQRETVGAWLDQLPGRPGDPIPMPLFFFVRGGDNAIASLQWTENDKVLEGFLAMAAALGYLARFELAGRPTEIGGRPAFTKVAQA